MSSHAPHAHAAQQESDVTEKGRSAGSGRRPGPGRKPHLLALLDAQLTSDLDTLDSVGEEVAGGVLQLVLVEGAREVPAQKDDSVGQQLRAGGVGSAFSLACTPGALAPLVGW